MHHYNENAKYEKITKLYQTLYWPSLMPKGLFIYTPDKIKTKEADGFSLYVYKNKSTPRRNLVCVIMKITQYNFNEKNRLMLNYCDMVLN